MLERYEEQRFYNEVYRDPDAFRGTDIFEFRDSGFDDLYDLEHEETIPEQEKDKE